MFLKVSRAWVATSNILRMSLPVEPPKSLKALKTGPLKNRLSKAINMAEQAKKMRKEDRLEKYSFATLFKGKWGVHPDSDTDEDEDDVPGRNRKLGKKRETKVIAEPRKDIMLQKKKKRTKTTPKIIRPDIFSDDDEDASTIVSPYKLQPKRNGISQSEDGSSESDQENEAESDSSSHHKQDGGHSDDEKEEESDEKDSTVDEAKLEEALNYPMPEMYELHSEKAKKGKKAGLPLPRKIKVQKLLMLRQSLI